MYPVRAPNRRSETRARTRTHAPLRARTAFCPLVVMRADPRARGGDPNKRSSVPSTDTESVLSTVVQVPIPVDHSGEAHISASHEMSRDRPHVTRLTYRLARFPRIDARTDLRYGGKIVDTQDPNVCVGNDAYR